MINPFDRATIRNNAQNELNSARDQGFFQHNSTRTAQPLTGVEQDYLSGLRAAARTGVVQQQQDPNQQVQQQQPRQQSINIIDPNRTRRTPFAFNTLGAGPQGQPQVQTLLQQQNTHQGYGGTAKDTSQFSAVGPDGQLKRTANPFA